MMLRLLLGRVVLCLAGWSALGAELAHRGVAGLRLHDPSRFRCREQPTSPDGSVRIPMARTAKR